MNGALWPGRASAGLRNDVPSCYAANNLQPAEPFGYTRLIYVLVDQTVGWTPDLGQSILDNLNSNLLPGTKFVIAEFSAYSAGRYLAVINTGVIEDPMPESQIDNTPIVKTRIFDACLNGQLPYAIVLADKAVKSAFQSSTPTLGHSDIMSALQAVSSGIAADPARDKLLLLASDGLENSSTTSFYRHGGMRDIDPATEIQRAAAAGLFGNFGGTRIFVIGGALEPAGASSSYRTDASLQHLKAFWQVYFHNSHAQLIEFGEPALLEPVGF